MADESSRPASMVRRDSGTPAAGVNCACFVRAAITSIPPCSRRMAAGSGLLGRESAYLWDARQRRADPYFHGTFGRVASAEFSPDGGSWPRPRTTRPRASGMRPRAACCASQRPSQSRLVRSVLARWSAARHRSYDKTARVWDVATGRELLQLLGHSAPVSSATCSPDGRYIATAPPTRRRSSGATTGQPVRTLSGHTDRVWYAAFSPDSRRVVTSSDDLAARIWRSPHAGSCRS